jgi:hypothetical protein
VWQLIGEEVVAAVIGDRVGAAVVGDKVGATWNSGSAQIQAVLNSYMLISLHTYGIKRCQPLGRHQHSYTTNPKQQPPSNKSSSAVDHSNPAEHFLISVLSYPIQQQRSSIINIVFGHHSLTV